MFRPDFLIIPTQLITDKRLTPTDCLVFSVIYWSEHLKNGRCLLSNEVIGKIILKDTGTVANSISKLRQLGYVGIIRHGNMRELTTQIAFKTIKVAPSLLPEGATSPQNVDNLWITQKLTKNEATIYSGSLKNKAQNVGGGCMVSLNNEALSLNNEEVSLNNETLSLNNEHKENIIENINIYNLTFNNKSESVGKSNAPPFSLSDDVSLKERKKYYAWLNSVAKRLVDVWNEYGILPMQDVKNSLPVAYRRLVFPVIERVGEGRLECAIRFYFWCVRNNLASAIDFVRWFTWRKYNEFQVIDIFSDNTIEQLGRLISFYEEAKSKGALMVFMSRLSNSRMWSRISMHHGGILEKLERQNRSVIELIEFYSDLLVRIKGQGARSNTSQESKEQKEPKKEPKEKQEQGEQGGVK